MNKTLKKLTVVTLAGLTLCGTAFAAPRGGHGKGHPPRPAPRHHHPAPKPHRHHHHGGHHHGNGWVTLGAAVVGGLVGGLVGGCR